MEISKMEKEVDRIMGNFYRISWYKVQVSKDELNLLVDKYDINCIVCQGMWRKLVITPITDKFFSLTSEPG